MIIPLLDGADLDRAVVTADALHLWVPKTYATRRYSWMTHRRIRHARHAMLISQPGQHPPRRMTLLTRRIQVRDQHRVDKAFRPSGRADRRTGTLRGSGAAQSSACRTVRRCTS